MRLLLCHHCWSWVAPSGVNCPDCHHLADITQPDPQAAQLACEFGDYVVRLSMIRVETRQLPAVGSLLGTTRGLMYLPFLEALEDGGLRSLADFARQRSLWSRWRFWQTPQFPAGRLLAAAAEVSLPDEPDLVQRFLDAPGSWFVPRDCLLRIHVRGKNWALTRTRGPVLRFQMLSTPEEWRPAWRQLLAASPEWQRLTT